MKNLITGLVLVALMATLLTVLAAWFLGGAW